MQCLILNGGLNNVEDNIVFLAWTFLNSDNTYMLSCSNQLFKFKTIILFLIYTLSEKPFKGKVVLNGYFHLSTGEYLKLYVQSL